MSLEDENRMLYVLHKNGVVRKHVQLIMEDIKKSGVFNDAGFGEFYEDEPYTDQDWKFIEEKYFWEFESSSSQKEINRALKIIEKRQEEYDKTKRSQYVLDQEKRIQEKQKELIEKGEVEPDTESELKKNISARGSLARYGRNPLHEAISFGDIEAVEKYIKMGQYINDVDNNNHTPRAMAYYYNYKEALKLFERYDNNESSDNL